jgi:hypothetical protein
MAAKQQASVLIGAHWTRNGEFFGKIRVPRGANDLHFEPSPESSRPQITFTKNGKPMGKPILPPPAANDVGFSWHGRGGIQVLIFTKDGKMIGLPEIPPRGVNDLHLTWQRRIITGAEWTIDGELALKINVPAGANDAHFFLLRAR